MTIELQFIWDIGFTGPARNCFLERSLRQTEKHVWRARVSLSHWKQASYFFRFVFLFRIEVHDSKKIILHYLIERNLVPSECPLTTFKFLFVYLQQYFVTPRHVSLSHATVATNSVLVCANFTTRNQLQK